MYVVTYEIGFPDKLMGSDLGTMGTTGAEIGSSGGLSTNSSCAVYDISCATMVDFGHRGDNGYADLFREYGNNGRCVMHLAGHYPGHSLRWMNYHLLTVG